MRFEAALECLRAARCMRRAAWPDVKRCVYLATPASGAAVEPGMLYLVLTVDRRITRHLIWSPTHADVLADDWETAPDSALASQ